MDPEEFLRVVIRQESSARGGPMRHALILLFFALGAAPTPALAASAAIDGAWRGSGTVSHRGNADAVKCTARFTKVGGASYAVTSHCATETGRYEVSGRVNAAGGNRYSGWVETNGQRGNVVILQQGNHLTVTVTSGKGAGHLSLSR
jgi:hypothetical protein